MANSTVKTISAYWTASDTSALMSEGLECANDIVRLRRRLAALLKIIQDNEINVTVDLVDDPGYALSKAQLQELVDWRFNFELWGENGVPAVGYWHAKIGKMSKVLGK